MFQSRLHHSARIILSNLCGLVQCLLLNCNSREAGLELRAASGPCPHWKTDTDLDAAVIGTERTCNSIFFAAGRRSNFGSRREPPRARMEMGCDTAPPQLFDFRVREAGR